MVANGRHKESAACIKIPLFLMLQGTATTAGIVAKRPGAAAAGQSLSSR